jgi:hypothetical protein
MRKDGFNKIVAVAGIILSVSFLIYRNAEAVPSYARQTGMACNLCHTVFPELTAFGRTFKASGYTLSQMKQIKEEGNERLAPLELNETLPLSLMFEAAYTRTDEKQPDTQNDDIQFPQQLSVFLAGELTSHIGSFLQVTYTQEDDNLSMDNGDIRFASQTEAGGKPLVYGLTLNNSPTVEDLWNSTATWGFPYASADAAPTPLAAAQIDGTLAQQVAGLGGYAFWANRLYGGVTVYRSAQVGEPSPPTAESNENTIEDVAPYWRLAWQQQWETGYLEVGTYGLYVKLHPDTLSGPTDDYTDVAFDFSCGRNFGNDHLSVHGTYILEDQDLNATFDAGGSSNPSNDLNTFRVDGNYYLGSQVGFSLAYFLIEGDTDAGLYSPAAVDGSANGSPDSDGWIGQVSYFPRQNVRLSAQYTWYTKFNGATNDYDGFGRDASDNNTFYVLAWFVW